MTDLAAWPDVEDLVLDVLADLTPTGNAGTITPPALASHLPFIRVTVFGGGDDGHTDTTRLDVDTFAGTYADARTLAEAVRQRLLLKPHVLPNGVLDRVVTLDRPHEVLWAADGSIRRFTAAYSAATRRGHS